MADIYSNGSVHVFFAVNPGSNTSTLRSRPAITGRLINEVAPGTATYLGTCQRCPEPQDQWQWSPVVTDTGASMVPIDDCYQGVLSAISLDLTRWSESALKLLKSPPFYGNKDPANGINYYAVTSAFARGSLALAQGNFYTLWLVNDFWLARQGGGPSDISPGRYAYACKTIGYYEPESGTVAGMRRLEVGIMDYSGNNANGFVAWSEDPGYFSVTAFNELII